jgi:hypothetical protein
MADWVNEMVKVGHYLDDAEESLQGIISQYDGWFDDLPENADIPQIIRDEYKIVEDALDLVAKAKQMLAVKINAAHKELDYYSDMADANSY